jgi:membrane protein implicated in regulation of membrane protease activity
MVDGLFNYLSDLGPWNWFFLAIALFIVDTVIPGPHLLWFRLAAIVVGVLTLATGVTWQWQTVSFSLLSLLAAIWVRKHLVADSDLPDLNKRGEQYLGRLLTVEEAIDFGRGKVRVGDTLWSAEGLDAPAGSRVKVTGARGTVLLVERDSNSI